MAGAVIITNPKIPIAVPLFSLGKLTSIIFINKGPMTEEPAACTIRPVSNKPKFGATAAKAVPRIKITIDVINKLLLENRVIKNADAGINIPLTSI